MLDVSQGVDRDSDTRDSGITGCLTPKGIPFLTTRGGPVLGIECLALQSIPIDKLQMLRESQSDIQDLAGNAMSTTVIGASILSSLISGYKLLPQINGTSHDAIQTQNKPAQILENNSLSVTVTDQNLRPISKSELLDLGLRSVRLCHCEGQTKMSGAPLQKCRDCKQTSCYDCGVDKRHRWEMTTPARVEPSDFTSFVKANLPMKVMISGISTSELEQLYSSSKESVKVWKTCQFSIAKAISSELRFHSMKRSSIWTITYEAAYARLDLLIASGYFEWRFFAKAEQKDPAGSDARRSLVDPILRMKPEEDNVLKGKWQAWIPSGHSFLAKVEGSGKLVRTFRNEIGLLDSADSYQWDSYKLIADTAETEGLDSEICGTYRLVSCPDTVAERSLHVKVDTMKSGSPLYLFLDPSRLGNPINDCFIISTDTRRLNNGEVRHRIAVLDAAWRLPVYIGSPIPGQPGKLKYTLKGSTTAAAELPNFSVTSIKVTTGGHWYDVPAAHLDTADEKSCSTVSQPGEGFTISPAPESCQNAHLVLSCEARIPVDEKFPWKKNRWVEVDDISYREFFKAFSWMLERGRRFSHLGTFIEVSSAVNSHCSSCAPAVPEITWSMPKGTAKLMPSEEPQGAAVFERGMKNRPSPFIIKVNITDAGLVQLKLAFNPETLMHRAAANLAPGDESVRVFWRLATGYVVPSMPQLPPFVLLDNSSDQPAQQPSGFNTIFRLRPEQLRSLGWQVRQEISPPVFDEEEVEEAFIPMIGWRGEGRATRSVTVRGGLLAHEVGYGKTITTLALIDTQRQQDLAESAKPVKGRIAVKATLILVPNQLPEQWFREAKKFLKHGSKYVVLKITTLAELQKLTIEDIQNADIIIASWAMFDGDRYMFLVAQFAGQVELPENAIPRAHNSWYHYARRDISEHVEDLKQGGTDLHSRIAEKLALRTEEAKEVETVVPSKRLKGQAYQNAKLNHAEGATSKKRKSMKSEKVQVLARNDPFELKKLAKGRVWQKTLCPLLEMFQFARIVVDEYQYANGKAGSVIGHLSSKSRWILSATPAMEDFADVKNMARFIGIHLGVDDVCPEATKSTNVSSIENDQTSKS